MDQEAVKNLMYRWSEQKTMKYIRSCTDPETLFLYAFNYNWDDEFGAPKEILKNPACTLSTALQLFYGGDGIRVLFDDLEDDEIEEWESFITDLYARIKNGEFPTEPKIRFEPPLSTVEMYELQKNLPAEDRLFITPIDGIDCYVVL